MSKTSHAFKISHQLLAQVKDFCEERGYKQGAFVERALREMIEKEEDQQDLFDLHRLRNQEQRAIPLDEYLKSRRRV